MTSCGDTSSNTASDSEISDNNLAGNNSDKENNSVPHVRVTSVVLNVIRDLFVLAGEQLTLVLSNAGSATTTADTTEDY